MANWVKTWNNRYINIGSIYQAFVSRWNVDETGETPGDGKWWIWIDDSPVRGLTSTTGYDTQVAAQTALDNAIAALGGAV